jgi:hypothetical protein
LSVAVRVDRRTHAQVGLLSMPALDIMATM